MGDIVDISYRFGKVESDRAVGITVR